MSRSTILAAALLCLWPLGALGQTSASPDLDEQLTEARRLIYEEFAPDRFDRAIELLQPIVEALQFDAEKLRQSYLLLIEAWVLRGNTENNPINRDLAHDRAKELIQACLDVPQLRHTRPTRPDFDEATVEYFDDIRRKMFGTFEITRLEPLDAQVVLDGDALSPDESGVFRQNDVPIGTRMLVIRHPKYQDFTADVEIVANTVVSSPYALQPNKGLKWWLTRVGAPVAAVAGVVVALVTSDEPPPDEPDPLPGPPGPPETP